jgi:hypothetical protein
MNADIARAPPPAMPICSRSMARFRANARTIRPSARGRTRRGGSVRLGRRPQQQPTLAASYPGVEAQEASSPFESRRFRARPCEMLARCPPPVPFSRLAQRSPGSDHAKSSPIARSCQDACRSGRRARLRMPARRPRMPRVCRAARASARLLRFEGSCPHWAPARTLTTPRSSSVTS